MKAMSCLPFGGAGPWRRLLAAGLCVALAAPAARAADPEDLAKIGLAGAFLGGLLAALSKGPMEVKIYDRGITHEPALGSDSKAKPGEAIFAVFRYEDVKSIRFGHNDRMAVEMVEAGTYCDLSSRTCFEDRDEDGVLDRNLATGRGVSLDYREEMVRVTSADSSFRYEILYQGAAAGVLRLLYREYFADLARPAFSQELVYDLAEGYPLEVVFKELDITVLEAGNRELSYVVNSERPSWLAASS